MGKPKTVGATILFFAKSFMFQFHYQKYQKMKLNLNLQLLYSDTDSFICAIKQTTTFTET